MPDILQPDEITAQGSVVIALLGEALERVSYPKLCVCIVYGIIQDGRIPAKEHA
jgi:hypothetical protein